jgi:PAS domain S-box-containing protein
VSGTSEAGGGEAGHGGHAGQGGHGGPAAERPTGRPAEPLTEAEETLRAIRRGEVDAFVVRHDDEPQVLVLAGVDRPYRLLIERMQQGAATVSPDGIIAYTNGRLPEMLGLPACSMAGLPLSRFVEQAEGQELAPFLERGRAASGAAEFSFRRSDGERIPALVTVSPLLDPEGTLCLVVTDLSQQKREEQLRETLAREQAARTAAEQQTETLLVADRRKNEFLAVLAHELRNPLAPIRNGLQVLKVADYDRALVERVTDMLERQVGSLVRLVDDLLDVGRISQGKVKLQKAAVDLNAIARRAIESCRGLIEQRGITFEVSLADEPVPVEADTERLIQILVNLLNNAVKFTPQGGQIRFAVQIDTVRCQCAVRIRDNGIGIDPGMLPRIFDLFVQCDSVVERREGGLGIGLTVASRLAVLHGGRIEALSDGLGRGSEFIVHLPLHQVSVQAPVQASVQQAPAQQAAGQQVAQSPPPAG